MVQQTLKGRHGFWQELATAFNEECTKRGVPSMIRSAKQALAHYHYCFVRHMYSKRLADDEQLLQMIGDGVTDIAHRHTDTNEARIQIRDLK